MNFPTNYNEILSRINSIDPIKYGKTRNFIDGNVTYLSPYISRGVISTKQILQTIANKGYELYEVESFVKELCWRDYFQRVWLHKDINQEIRNPQSDVSSNLLPVSILNSNTGVKGIDISITDLYESGYMHNHCRMYTASVVCNIAKCHWLLPAKWMYYHLLDGDWASNACSWQWVAGANSNKKYFANQENISKFTKSEQQKSFLTKTYEELETMNVPGELKDLMEMKFTTLLPANINSIKIDKSKPTLIYNYYNLDAHWHEEKDVNRIFLLEPELFKSYPVSNKCMDFIIELSKNIKNIQIYIGSYAEFISEFNITSIVYKEHPLNKHYRGNEEPREWVCNEITDYFPSFFGYWNKVEKYIKKEYFS